MSAKTIGDSFIQITGIGTSSTGTITGNLNVNGTVTLPSTTVIGGNTTNIQTLLDAKAATATPIFTGNIGIGTATARVALDIVSTSAILAPAGTAVQRPTGVKGYLRYNTTDDVFEGFSGAMGAWSSIGAGGVVNEINFTGNSKIAKRPDKLYYPLKASKARTSASDNGWYGIAWAPELGLFAAVANTGTGNRVMTSPDGITWTSRTSAADIGWLAIAWAPELGLFAAVANTGTGNRVMTSPDGITWTIRTSAADNGWYGIAWAPQLGLFAAVANTGTGNRAMTIAYPSKLVNPKDLVFFGSNKKEIQRIKTVV